MNVCTLYCTSLQCTEIKPAAELYSVNLLVADNGIMEASVDELFYKKHRQSKTINYTIFVS